MRKFRDHVWDWFKVIFIALIIVLFIKNFLMISVEIKGISMSPGLKSNDYIVVNTTGKIKRFDIVVFQNNYGRTYVKRVVGLPGEQIAYKNDRLYIDQKPVKEVFWQQNGVTTKKNQTVTADFDLQELTNEQKIPKNHYFVLGDNRRISKDSRTFGAIPEEWIIGKAVFVYYPLKHIHFIE